MAFSTKYTEHFELWRNWSNGLKQNATLSPLRSRRVTCPRYTSLQYFYRPNNHVNFLVRKSQPMWSHIRPYRWSRKAVKRGSWRTFFFDVYWLIAKVVAKSILLSNKRLILSNLKVLNHFYDIDKMGITLSPGWRWGNLARVGLCYSLFYLFKAVGRSSSF